MRGFFIIATALMIFSNCHPNQSLSKSTLLQQKAAEILKLDINITCLQDQDCKTIGFGVKPCGGYIDYLTYSNVNLSADLIAKVKQYNILSKEMIQEEQIVSNCAVTPEPSAQCLAGQCQIVTQLLK